MQNAASGAEANAAAAGVSGYTRDKGPQSYVLQTFVALQPDGGEAGGAASFGIVDGGPVLLLGHAAYLPRLMPAQVKRGFMTPRPPLTAQQLPRFMMLCVWPLEGGKPGQPVAAHVELDEANIRIDRERSMLGMRAYWVAISAARAPKAFAERDYCGEIAKTGRSSAAPWLLDRPGRP